MVGGAVSQLQQTANGQTIKYCRHSKKKPNTKIQSNMKHRIMAGIKMMTMQKMSTSNAQQPRQQRSIGRFWHICCSRLQRGEREWIGVWTFDVSDVSHHGIRDIKRVSQVFYCLVSFSVPFKLLFTCSFARYFILTVFIHDIHKKNKLPTSEHESGCVLHIDMGMSIFRL
jgi:hypothetical protein